MELPRKVPLLDLLSRHVPAALVQHQAGDRARRVDDEIDLRVHRRYNPENITAYNIVPGLVGVILTLTMVMFTSMAIVRERERGTLEQLMVTPASPIAVVFGKLLPYLALSFLQLLVVLALMSTVFRVPIHGSVPLLLLSERAVAFYQSVSSLTPYEDTLAEPVVWRR